MNDKLVYYSRCSVGKGRWFWVAYLEEDYFDGHDPFVSGFASSAEEAEGQAVTTAKEAHPERECRQIQGYQAIWFRRCLAARKKAQKQSEGSSASQLEFLYRDWFSDYDDERHSSLHRIVKKTKTRVYVDKERRSRDFGDWRDFAYQETFVLDRAVLEREGKVWSRSMGDHFYTTPYEERRHLYAAESDNSFGLKAPWTTEQVKKAFRQLVKKAHPDNGGDPEEFKTLYNQYLHSLALAVE